MNKKKMYTMAGGLALVAAIGIGSTLAYFTDQEHAENTVEFGNVNITYSQDDWNDNKTDVTPGKTFELNPTITVDANSNSAYVRMKVDYSITNKENKSRPVTDKELQDIESRLPINRGIWEKGTDGYWYCQNVLNASDEVTLFEEITIPDQWGNDYVEDTLNVDITAEAIQSENVEDVINVGGLITSWGDVTVETLK